VPYQYLPLAVLLVGVPVMVTYFAALTLGAYLTGDPLWPRTFGRGLTVLVFLVCMSGGLWLRLWWATR
jgi:hypothetical protein